ncbi:MAG TPA: ABC transporter permease subunit [Nocardioidaceae bacterium]|nr:ABC transporter permease subunit [Nocardioidaceae bacterium]
MSTSTATRSGAAANRRAASDARERSKRLRLAGVVGVLVVWLVGWLVLRGRDTLFLATGESNAFHRWLFEARERFDLMAQTNFFFETVIGGISDGLNWVVETGSETFAEAAFPRPVPEVGWLGVIALAAWVVYALAGARMAALVTLTLLACGFLGFWADSIDTLIVTLVAVALCVLIGLPLAILMSRSKRLTAVATPVLDAMQTTPPLAYLAPLALVFGIGAAPAVMVTLIFALPPLVRIAAHGLRTVSPTSVEAANSMGSTSWQTLRRVQLPMARRTIIVGLNQTTMAALSMVTIAALISGPGLGQPVIQALSTLDVGGASVAGLCIVIIAIMLDRVTTAASEFGEAAARARRNVRRRRLVLAGSALAVVVAIVMSRLYLQVAAFPTSPNLGAVLADWVAVAQTGIVDTFGGVTLAIKNFISFQFLNPLESLLGDTPWWLMSAVIVALAALLGGLRALFPTVVCIAIILGTGLWHDTMLTLAMTLVATIVVMLLGLAVGVWMGRSRRVDTAIRPILDALQTIPPFVYLVPAVALFNVGRFTAIIAAVAFAAPAAIKIIADGIRGVSAATVEAAESSGSTRLQMIGKVQLPMSRESVVLAANQGLLLVLSMVVIGGMVGGGSLGFLVVTGFSQLEDFGKGLAASIAIVALGVMLDRITKHTAARFGRVDTR